jgi:hypothetical protein
MKNIYVIAIAVVIAGCSTHSVRCRGALRPINQPVPITRRGKATEPDAGPGKHVVVPGEPRP